MLEQGLARLEMSQTHQGKLGENMGGAKAGNLKSCENILEIMLEIYEKSLESKKDAITEEAAAAAAEEEAYLATEPTLRPMIRWLLFTTFDLMKNSNFNENLKLEIQELLVDASDEARRGISH
jgi:hypothetical protein